MDFTPHTWFDLNGIDLAGRIVVTIIVFLLAVFFMGFVIWKKKNNKTKIWFTPYGLNTSNYLTRYKNMSFKDKLFKTDYKWWFFLSLIFLIYWFGAYLVVSIVILTDYNQFIINYSEVGYELKWDASLLNSSGLKGRYVVNGDPKILEFVLSQTNVSYYLRNLEDYLNYRGITDQIVLNTRMNLWLHSWVYSNIFITPLCQSLAIIFPLSIIFSYKKDRASIIAPWAFLGGSVTIFGGIAGDESIHITWQFVIYDQQIFLLYHTFLMIVGFAWFAYTYRYSLKRWGLYMLFIVVYVFYVIVTAKIFNIEYFTTGMTPFDLTISGSYEIVETVLGDAVPFPANLTIMLIVFVGFAWLVTCLKNYIHWKYYWKNINKEESFKNDINLAILALKNNFKKFVSNKK